MQRYILSSSLYVSKYLAILGWSNFLKIEISFSSYFNSSAVNVDVFISLTAYLMDSSKMFVAKYTVPKAPLPKTFSSKE